MFTHDHVALMVRAALEQISLPSNTSELTRAIAAKDYLENVLGIEVPLSEVRAVLQEGQS